MPNTKLVFFFIINIIAINLLTINMENYYN